MSRRLLAAGADARLSAALAIPPPKPSASERESVPIEVNTVNVGATSREQALIGFSVSAENQADLIGVIGNGIAYTPMPL